MKYELLNRLGAGGYGVVFRALDRNTNRFVALKFLPHREDDPGYAERNFNETYSHARLDHPNIVKVHGAGQYPDGREYIEMQLITGGDLSARLADEQMRRAELAVDLIATAARAVDFAHRQGIIHGDLKPGNILIDEQSRSPLVTDFGAAKMLGLSDDEVTARVGTLAYMAPEQCGYQPDRLCQIDRWTDIYALGAMLYQMLSGARPYARELEARAAAAPTTDRTEAPKSPLQQRRELFEAGLMPTPLSQLPRHHTIGRGADRELDIVVLGALAIHRADRYESAAALARDLDRWVHGLAVHGPKRDAPPLTRRARTFLRHNAQ
ncbi:MAG: serine/threonine-protein kinase, partial [Polyangiales bacterium]